MPAVRGQRAHAAAVQIVVDQAEFLDHSGGPGSPVQAERGQPLGAAVVGEGVQEGVAGGVVGLACRGQQRGDRGEEHEVFEGFVPQVAVQEMGADGLGVVDGVEGGPVQIGDERVADLSREVEHPAYGWRPAVPVGVEPACQGVLVGDVEGREDGLRAERLQLAEQGDGPALGGGGVGVGPFLPGRDGGAPDQDDPAGPAAYEGAAQQPAERAERAGDQIASVGPQSQRQRPGQALGGAEAAGAAAAVAQGDLLLVVAEDLAEERFGLGPVGVGARLPSGVEVDEFAGVFDQFLVAQHAADAPGGCSEGFGPLAGQGGLGSSGDDVQTASVTPGEQEPGEGDQ